jgi:predicted nucleic acid-binding protein
VNVYVESNFVLELALLQEQHTSCEELMRLCEEGRIQLVIPAYSLAEPYETLTRRHRQRKRMKAELDDQLRQLARTMQQFPLLTLSLLSPLE